MTQQELDQICTDIFDHGRQVQGWSCDQSDAGRTPLTDNKRGHAWERATPGGQWAEATKHAQ